MGGAKVCLATRDAAVSTGDSPLNWAHRPVRKTLKRSWRSVSTPSLSSIINLLGATRRRKGALLARHLSRLHVSAAAAA